MQGFVEKHEECDVNISGVREGQSTRERERYARDKARARERKLERV